MSEVELEVVMVFVLFLQGEEGTELALGVGLWRRLLSSCGVVGSEGVVIKELEDEVLALKEGGLEWFSSADFLEDVDVEWKEEEEE
mmetsp:Transcript_31123/g.68628  ORF Transcript_31123/g.68628 Transcript_31123/m.68628 type:complete len:86 (-) Transcript_31123:240-497(-)|eukprot:CAMPEP_0173188430 /NCGR_PEP_ID=MMETSP1141-20130122/11253_1 /TAXON_ID=483371 /ORGANISM="non described non described, Strain CCMP2298" /LENGTH=85 /DNA_ID=CAMNT_0014112363 /DNA_START=291 /DNA_END=548 /DNA_ORIENTATION=-